VTLEAGNSGQFDVLADGELIATRDSGLLMKLLRAGWPNEADVVAKIKARLEP
jgi:hypothetical protein